MLDRATRPLYLARPPTIVPTCEEISHSANRTWIPPLTSPPQCHVAASDLLTAQNWGTLKSLYKFLEEQNKQELTRPPIVHNPSKLAIYRPRKILRQTL